MYRYEDIIDIIKCDNNDNNNIMIYVPEDAFFITTNNRVLYTYINFFTHTYEYIFLH